MHGLTAPAGQVLDDTLGDANANEQLHTGDGDDQVENDEAAHGLGVFASADAGEGEEEDGDGDDNQEGGAENGQDVLHAFDDHGDHNTAMTWQAVFDAAGEDGEALVEAGAAEGEFEGGTGESLLGA